MLDFGWSQMLLIAAVALVVLGPKELPRVLKTVSEWAGKARTLAREFRSSVDEMVRESELKNLKEDFEKAASKAESDFHRTIEAETSEFRDLSSDPSISSDPIAAADDTAGWTRAAKLQPLMDHQRKKKPQRKAARLALKPRRIGPPPPRHGAAGVRRRVRA
jgi:sec-independent protein translocase protein TatB